jgi:hypothetical protein
LWIIVDVFLEFFMKSFSERLADDQPMVYDGGFGSQLFERGVNLANSSLANASHPDVLKLVQMLLVRIRLWCRHCIWKWQMPMLMMPRS